MGTMKMRFFIVSVTVSAWQLGDCTHSSTGDCPAMISCPPNQTCGAAVCCDGDETSTSGNKQCRVSVNACSDSRRALLTDDGDFDDLDDLELEDGMSNNWTG